MSDVGSHEEAIGSPMSFESQLGATLTRAHDAAAAAAATDTALSAAEVVIVLFWDPMLDACVEAVAASRQLCREVNGSSAADANSSSSSSSADASRTDQRLALVHVVHVSADGLGSVGDVWRGSGPYEWALSDPERATQLR